MGFKWDLGWDLGFGMGMGFGIWDGIGWDGLGWAGMGVGILPFPLIWLASIVQNICYFKKKFFVDLVHFPSTHPIYVYHLIFIKILIMQISIFTSFFFFSNFYAKIFMQIF